MYNNRLRMEKHCLLTVLGSKVLLLMTLRLLILGNGNAILFPKRIVNGNALQFENLTLMR